ncbi:MAG: exodeoxyribonuclease III, partial [Thiotrichales bacterium]|nr:exodeoxyribonuclease III [Thiotrichales bacterium]
ADPQQRVLAADYGPVCLLNLYVPNGSEVGSEKYQYKLDWFAQLHPYVEHLLKEKTHLVIVGDMNIAPEDIDVHDPEEWSGKVLVSAAERAEFQRLIGQGLVDCFRALDTSAGAYSWWDYRAAAFRRDRGLRIDHILASRALSKQLKSCRIDKAPRKRERPSDHTPVIAEFDL